MFGVRMGFRLFFVAVGTAALALPATPARAGDACWPLTLGSGTVTAVTDGRSFTLDDGREVRLAGLQLPAAGPHAAGAGLRPLIGRPVTLRAAARGTDRYGRLLAYAFVSGSETPLQYSLLMHGQAVVAARGEAGPCRAALLAQEKAAREARLGLWAEPANAPRPAGQAAPASDQGRFALIEGKVLSVREAGATIYVNFGRRFAQSFSVTIRKQNERAFRTAGLAPRSLEGRILRVRGWIEQRLGSRIEALVPEQIEVVE
jgi:endonuclease YncB( thermonuclease family)